MLGYLGLEKFSESFLFLQYYPFFLNGVFPFYDLSFNIAYFFFKFYIPLIEFFGDSSQNFYKNVFYSFNLDLFH